jgi:hypothetical protein
MNKEEIAALAELTREHDEARTELSLLMRKLNSDQLTTILEAVKTKAYEQTSDILKMALMSQYVGITYVMLDDIKTDKELEGWS